jgi:hypothetical protein
MILDYVVCLCGQKEGRRDRMVDVFPSNYPTGTIKCNVYEFECLSRQAIVDAVFNDNVCQ